MSEGTTARGVRKEACLELKLYVAGDSPNSMAARSNLRAVLAQHPDRVFELETIDVLADPDRGLRDGVLVTPTLVVGFPTPRRIIGALKNLAQLREVLGLEPPAT